MGGGVPGWASQTLQTECLCGGQDPLQHPWEGWELMTVPRLTGQPPGAAHLLPEAADVLPAIPLFPADQGQLRKLAQNSSLPGPSGLQERPAQKLSRDRRALPCVLAISGSCCDEWPQGHCARPHCLSRLRLTVQST